jgi:hypothetical protein
MNMFLSNLASQGLELINKVFPDKTQVEKDQLVKDLKLIETSLEEKKIDQQLLLAQTEVNKAEAMGEHIFKSGWRPCIGWVCAVCLSLYYIPQFILGSFLWVRQCMLTSELVSFPVNPDSLFQIITGMLGIAALRSIDKIIPKIRK